jgi:hypothetical protein
MEIGPSKEGCFKSKQGHARSGYKGRKENEGWVLTYMKKESFIAPGVEQNYFMLHKTE